MKTLAQFIAESVSAPGTFNHFWHHVSKMREYHHKADNAKSEVMMDRHHASAEHHADQIIDHHGIDHLDEINNPKKYPDKPAVKKYFDQHLA